MPSKEITEVTPPRFCQRTYACRYPACDCWPHTPRPSKRFKEARSAADEAMREYAHIAAKHGVFSPAADRAYAAARAAVLAELHASRDALKGDR